MDPSAQAVELCRITFIEVPADKLHESTRAHESAVCQVQFLVRVEPQLIELLTLALLFSLLSALRHSVVDWFLSSSASWYPTLSFVLENRFLLCVVFRCRALVRDNEF